MMRDDIETMSDGTKFYTFKELGRLIEQSRKTKGVRMPLGDAILVLLYSQREKPIFGRTMLMKQLFLFLEELSIRHEPKFQDPRYVPFKYGPYSFLAMNRLENLQFAGYVEGSGRRNSRKERFVLTEAGCERAKRAYSALPKTFRKELEQKRIGWDQLGTDGIIRYVYANYPKFKERSEIKAKYKDITWGKGKA